MLDITYDFRTDSRGKDPDGYSPTLNAYHKALWSKELPNGEVMDLQSGKPPYAFRWKEFWFSSDTIIVEMLHWRNKKIVDQVRDLITDSEGLFAHLVSRSYSIGGTIIFPVHKNSMNQMRGMNILISDRWDLTLECIRRHYTGEESPLSKVIESDKAFYDLFVDFKGYVEFFFLQDCVSEDYSSVNIWIGDASFKKSGLPETVEEYIQFLVKEHIFLDKRNRRIQEYGIKYNLIL